MSSVKGLIDMTDLMTLPALRRQRQRIIIGMMGVVVRMSRRHRAH